MPRSLPSFIGCSALLALALPLSAQSTAPVEASGIATVAPAPATANRFAVTPTAALLSAPIEAAPEQSASRSIESIGKAMMVRRSRTESTTLMIVGGAGILTGILIDEGLISFAGAAVGLYGLYLHLR